YNNQTDGVIYINDVLYNYKGDMPGGTVVNVREGTVSISPDAFYNCSGLTSVTIPNSVTSIGNRAFYGCSSLNSVIIPNSVTSIGNRAFERCSGLTEITIPNSVTSIGNYAFEGCSALMAIDVSENNTAYASENGVLFNKAKSDLIKYPEGKQDASYNIPNSVTSIGEYAFSSCSALTSVTIGNSVTSIGGFAFYYCSGLTSVTNLNPTPQSINSNVFQNVDLINATLYVPAESVEDYKAAEIWKDFKEIKAYIPSAIESPTVGSSINIYPNPVVESFRINGITAPTEVIVTDLSGRTVLQQTINAGESVAVGNLPKGVYIVRIEGKTVKVVKR
ncbi:MAG: leucine-rich repeat domain-containing protein, partial [Dysgonamonadaceae bacterium]|nr:leucine-rich repeat domain-containing protein [Dysgonamonadaceae bacterium]